MRIAIAHYYWDYPEPEYVLPSALARGGNEVILSVWKGGSGQVQTKRENGFTVFMLPGMNLASPLGITRIKNPYVSGLMAVYDAFSPEIVDCQSHLFFTTIESMREARRRGIPAVVTVRGVMAKRDFLVNSAQRVYLYTLASRVFREAALVRCLTRSDAIEVGRYGCPGEKVRVIPNFIDTGSFAPGVKGGDRVLWYGRFVEEKGLKVLVAAAREVIAADRDAKFVLAGDGPQREYVGRTVEGMGIQSNFSLPGRVDREGLRDLLDRASMVVVPSFKEGMPFSLLEAMSSGKAVVASDIPGINDIIEDGKNGILVPPGDPKALASAVARLRRDPAAAERLGREARATVLEKYSERVVIGRIEAMYREAVDSYGG